MCVFVSEPIACIWVFASCVSFCERVYFFDGCGGVRACTWTCLSHKQTEDLKHWIEIRFLAGIWGSSWRVCVCVSVYYVAVIHLQAHTSRLPPTQTQSLVTFHSKSSDWQMTSILNLNGNTVTSTLILYPSNELPLQVNGVHPAHYNSVTFTINYDQHSATV